MAPDLGPALAHIRIMESRIEQQVASIERLKHDGQDVSKAVQRLALLQHALEEMRIQLGHLAPTELDGMRSKAEALRSKLLPKD